MRRGPRLIEPLSTFLAREQPDIFLPGASAVPYDSITVLEENPRFVESFLAGANEELRRELVYREYPSISARARSPGSGTAAPMPARSPTMTCLPSTSGTPFWDRTRAALRSLGW